MPELSRFEGMIVYLLFRDNKEHNKPLIMGNTRRQSGLMASCLPENYQRDK